MKKIILVLISSILFFFVFRFLSIKYDDYINNKKCTKSEYVADGDRLYVTFVLNIAEEKMLNNISIDVITKQGVEKKVSFTKNENNSASYYTDNKILKSDTLIINVIKNKRYKVYNFKSSAKRINAGQKRGEYYCTLNYKINSEEIEGDDAGCNNIVIHI
jgi:hypothetical protein